MNWKSDLSGSIESMLLHPDLFNPLGMGAES